MSPDPLPLREILVCQAFDKNREVLLYTIILRKGLHFELLSTIQSDHAALLTDENTLKLLEGKFQLPVRVLLGSNGAFLGVKTLFAHKKGSPYSLKPSPAP